MSRAVPPLALLLLAACEPHPPTTPTHLAAAVSRALVGDAPDGLQALFLRGDALAAACPEPAALVRMAAESEAELAACRKLGAGGGDVVAAGGEPTGPVKGCGAAVVGLGEILAVAEGGGRGVLMTIPSPVRVGDRLYLAGGLRCVEVPDGARGAFATMLRIHEVRAASGASTGDVLASLRDFSAHWQAATGRERASLDRALACMRSATRQEDLDNCTASLGGAAPLPLGCRRYFEFLKACRAELPEADRASVTAIEAETRTSWNTVVDDGALAHLCADELAAAVRDVHACPKATAAAFESPTRKVGEASAPAGVVRPTAALVASLGRSPGDELAAARLVVAAFARGPGERAPEALTSALETVAAADPATPVVGLLLRYAYLKDAQGTPFLHAVRHALVKRADPDITPRLVAIARGEDADVAAFAAAHGVMPWELTLGATTLRLLLDRLDPASLPVFIENLEAPLAQPAGLDGASFDAWRHAQVERLKLAMFGVGHLATDADLRRLGAIVRNRDLDKTNQRLNAAAAVAMVGTVAAQDLLLDVFANERDEGFRAALVQLIALALDDRRLARFDALVQPDDTTQARSPELAQALTKNDALRIFLGVVRACGDDRSCYVARLRNARQDDQLKALAVLGRGRFGNDPELRAAILKTLDHASINKTDVRRFGTLALARLGTPDDGLALVRLGASLDEEEDFWRDEYLQLGTAIRRRKSPSP